MNHNDAEPRPAQAPAAFSGSRMDWRDLPRHIRERIRELAGAEVLAELTATSGFSPGFAAVLELGDGQEVFVKAVSPEQNPDSPDLARREIVAARHIPPQVPAPALLWSHDDGGWVILGFQAVHGKSPELPWRPAELQRVLGAATELAATRPVDPDGLPTAAEAFTETFSGWRSLAAMDTATLTAMAAGLGDLGAWALDHHDDLVAWESDGVAAASGDRLVHGDLRADNLMLDDGHVWIVDWVWACTGAPWIDLACMLPSVAMQGGGDPQKLFWSHPVSGGVDPVAARAVVAGLAGYFASQAVAPAPLGLPGLRAFQGAQAVESLRWLRSMP